MSTNPALAKKSKNNSKRYARKVIKSGVNTLPKLVKDVGKLGVIVRDVEKDLKREGFLGNKG